MSYCRKEGKDIIMFATEEDLAGPSKVTLLPEDTGDMDTSHQGAILPDGTINWDCPCLGNLPNGPCGSSFRDAFSCWVENKSDQDSFASQCFDSFTAWEECLTQNRDIYKSESDKSDSEEQKNNKAEAISNDESTELDDGQSLNISDKQAIAAAYAEETQT